MSKPATVLVIEGNSDFRFIVAHGLRQLGMVVVEAENGDSALSLIQRGLCPKVITLIYYAKMSAEEFY